MVRGLLRSDSPEALKHVQRHFDIRKFESSNSGNMLMTLQQNEGLELLRDFARKQFCAEHIGFCEAVDRFHTLPEGERNEGAAKCYAQFINPESVDNARADISLQLYTTTLQ